MSHNLIRKVALSTTAKSSLGHVRVNWLDLRGTGLSMLERLSLEEALLRHDDRNWAIVGDHNPNPHLYLTDVQNPQYSSTESNPDCMVVMGIGGKPELLLNIPQVKQDGVLVCKRFSGGGTVALDSSSLWTTFIGRNTDFGSVVEPYPRPIMQWSADDLFGPTFNRLLEDYNQKNTTPVTFDLRENDYILAGSKKIGGNAQALANNSWLHHTSFLWDYDSRNMSYLQLPSKRPDYRGDRDHDDFLVTLKPYFSKEDFFASLLQTCQESFQLENSTLPQAMEVVDEHLGGMQKWWEDNRTKIVDDF